MAINDIPKKKWFWAQSLHNWRYSLPGRLVGDSFQENGRLYAVAIIAMVLVAASAAATAWIMERIIDAGSVILIFVVRGLAGYLQAVYLARAGNRIVARQQDNLYRKLLNHGVTFYRDIESSDLLTRFTQGAQAARSLVEIIVVGFVRDLLTMLFLLGVMFYQQPTLSLIILIVGPLAFFGVRSLLLRVRSIMEQEMMSLAEIIKVMQETSAGILALKTA
jgi:subfamily B ATP-binding cassette protein MsbA